MNMSMSNAVNGQPPPPVPGGIPLNAMAHQQLQQLQAAQIQAAVAAQHAHAQQVAQAQAAQAAQAQAAAAIMGLGHLGGHPHAQHPLLAGIPVQNGLQAHHALHPGAPPGLAAMAGPLRINHAVANHAVQQVPTVTRPAETKRSEIYKYTSPRPLYSANWSMKKNEKFRLAVGSLVDRELGNRVSIIQLDDATGQLMERGSFAHEYAPNCIRFIPDLECNYPDLLATSSDLLRIHRIQQEIGGSMRITEDCILTSNKSAQYTAPLTSFDWNEVDPRLIGTASIDTTCTIFDVEVGQPLGTLRPMPYNVKTQLIAHDKPVHDIGFSKIFDGKNHFATVGADGSCRMFDLRNLEHSTIVYEDPHKTPLMRLAWNKHEPNTYHLATFAQDSTDVIIIDIRVPCQPLSRLKNHSGAVNGIAWAPHSGNHICTAGKSQFAQITTNVGDDSQALIWDVSHMPRPVEDPILAYSAGGEVCQVHWGAAHSNWICIVFNKYLEILRV